MNNDKNQERREVLKEEVREQYANFIHKDSQQHFHQTTSGITPEKYYDNICDKVVDEISRGTFDNCKTGKEIANKVAADKKWIQK